MFRLSSAKRTAWRGKRKTAVITRDKVDLKGGLNLIDAADGIPPGMALAARNYEAHYSTGAYRRIAGYEVFDGRPRPHKAEYWKIDLQDIDGGPFVYGELVQSGADTAVVLEYVVDTEGADDSGYLIVSELTNDVDAGATWTGQTSGATGIGESSTEYEGILDDEDAHDAAYLLAENYRRSFITEVGEGVCEGPVWGVHVYRNKVYAFRNLIGGGEGSMWVSSSSGWDRVELGFKVIFVEGSEQPDEGDEVVGATSGAQGVIRRMSVTAGFWSGGDAEGYFVVETISNGPFVPAEDLLRNVGGNVMARTSSSEPQRVQALAAGGKYRFRNYNYGGHTSTLRMYGCNGVNNAFEFDGSTFVLIETGMEFDTPNQIGVHRGHLLLAYQGGSLQHSGKNNPLSFQPVLGANEILAGDEITGFIEEVGDVTFVFTRNKTWRLEGFVQENIKLRLHNNETGGIEDTIQRIGRSVYLDDRGFTRVPTTDQFGDFASNQISIQIEPLVQELLATSEIEGSVVNKGLSVYRCFFKDRGAISITFAGNDVAGISQIDYGLSIKNLTQGEIENEEGNAVERLFAGDEQGYVYELDVGKNFNGEPLVAYVVTAYHFSGTPEVNKRYRRATLYLTAEGRTTLRIAADYNYSEDAQNFEEIFNDSEPLGGGRYGIDRHFNFLYSRASQGDIRVPMNSHARNVSMIVYHEETNEEPHILYAIQYHVSGRRIIRA